MCTVGRTVPGGWQRFMNVFYPRLTLDGLFRRFVEAGEDGEGEGGDGEEEDEPDLDQEVAASSLMIVPVVTVVVDEGDDKRRECTQVEEGGEDGEDQESPLLALVGAAGSGHA